MWCFFLLLQQCECTVCSWGEWTFCNLSVYMYIIFSVQLSVALLSYVVCRHRCCRSLYSGCHLIFSLFFFHFSMCISTWIENFKWEKNYNRFFMGFKMIYMDYPQNVQMNRNLEHLLHNIKINLRIFQKESQTYWLHFNSFQMEPLRIWVIRCFAWNSTNPMVNHDFWQMCFDSQFCFLPSHDSPL